MRYLSLFFLASILIGCGTIDLSEAYKSHLTEKQLNGHRVELMTGVIIHNDYHTLPHEVFKSLPGEYRIAGLTDHLVVVQDTLGKIKFSSNIFIGNKRGKNPSKLTTGEYLRVLHSNAYKENIRERRNSGQIEYSIPGYMNVVAFKDSLNYEEIIQTQYAQSWISWIKEYDHNLNDLKNKLELKHNLESDINNSQNLIQHLNIEENNIKENIKKSKQRAQNLKNEYNELRKQKEFAIINYGSNLKLKYDYEKDPLKPYYDNNLVDITNYDWNINSGVSNKTLHTSTVDAYKKANDIFKNPEKYFSKEFADKVKLLDSPEIFSASRTIIHQATLTSNPSAAGWLNSNHAMGLSVDMTFAGKNYNTRIENPTSSQFKNYEVFKKVMEKAGFVNTTSPSDWRERNHFTVEHYALKKDGQSIHDPFGERKERIYNETATFFEGFADTADFQGKELENKIKQVVGENSDLLEHVGKLEEEIENKRKKIDKYLKELEESRINEKHWEKARNKEKDRIARARRRDTRCLSSEMNLDAIEFKMKPITNSIKHWDCRPVGGEGRCLF